MIYVIRVPKIAGECVSKRYASYAQISKRDFGLYGGKMKKLVLLSLCMLIGFAFAKPMPDYQIRKPLDSPVLRPHVQQSRIVPEYTFVQAPTSVMTSYHDYMIGSYNSLPLRLIPDVAGGGYFITFQGKRTAYGTRRVFFAHLGSNGNLIDINEITSILRPEGYPTLDVDPVSGKPLYAWHANHEDLGAPFYDDEYEVEFCSYSFLQGIPGIFNEIEVAIDNPLEIMIDGAVASSNNEFIWPTIEIGISPLPGKRRVYIVARNSVSHNWGGWPCENVLIAYADFDGNMIDTGVPLQWSYTSIPEMDQWNHANEWRRPFHFITTDDLGNIYYVGYHEAHINLVDIIDEPDLDIFMCPNYGQGTWSRVTDYSHIPTWNPPATLQGNGLFLDSDGVALPDDELHWGIVNSGHSNAVSSGDGKIIFPALFSVCTDTGDFYPGFHTVKAVVYDILESEFTIREIYPQKNPEDDYNEVFTPWDKQAPWGEPEYAQGVDGGYYLDIESHYPFPHWDSTLHTNTMMFHYNNLKLTKVNDQGMMAAVWQDSQRARLYNLYPDLYPELAFYANTPEIYISVSSDRGQNWSEPIVLNKVETPELSNLKPMWVYPADLVKYMGMQDDCKVGRLGLMFYDDYTWGANSINPPAHHEINGGKVMFIELQIVFPQHQNPLTDPFGYPTMLSSSMTLMARVLIDDQPASEQDVLAAFVDVNGQPQLRGKQSLQINSGISGCLMQIYTETNDEDIYFLLWDASSNQVLSVNEGLSSIVNGTVGSWPDNLFWLHAVSNPELIISLRLGWNMFSLNLHPFDTSIEGVFADIIDNVQLVKSPDGVYQPGNPYNSITNLLDGKGYCANMSAPVSLIAEGYSIAESTPLPLQEGWNLAGYLPQGALEVSTAVASIASHLVQIKGMEGVYEPGNPFNNLSALSPGRSYWMKLDSAANLIYPAENRSAGKTAKAQPIPEKLIIKSNSQSILLGFEPGVQADDTIMAFVDGELRGITKVKEADNQMAALLQIFCESAGEQVEFKLKSSSTGNISLMKPGIQTAPGTILGDYAQGEYFILQESQPELPESTTSLKAAYPNPFTRTTSIALTLGKDEQNITVEIYNIRGQKVKTLIQERLSAPQMNLIWDGQDDSGRQMPSGIYFCRLSHAKGDQTVKLMLLK
jgi:hypothetical protein